MKHFNGNKKAGIFVALTVMAAMVIEGHTLNVFDNLQDIWQSPSRLTTIEADINEINERLSVIKLGDSRVAAFNP